MLNLRVILLAGVALAACSTQRPISRPGPAAAPATAKPADAARAPVYAAPELPPPATEASAPPALPATSASRIALLLPLGGALAASSEAIRDGFLQAQFAAGSGELRIYDSGSDAASARAAYAEAQREGAQWVVGPLRKEDVQALADQGTPPVPVLALNYLDAGRRAPARFHQFGLSAEDEARAAAADALAQGLTRALTLTPQGDWGERALRAFEQAFTAAGGVIVQSERYDARTVDQSDTLRTLLAIESSRERQRALLRLLGGKLEFEPRRRDDADLVFFAARGDGARTLAPQLRFNRASGLPMYANAPGATGSEALGDLQGLRWCDGPWMLDAAGPWADLREESRALFPQRGAEHARLSALGYDAWQLAARLADGSDETVIAGATGRLRAQADGAFARELSCVEVAGGKLKPTR